MTLVRLFAYSFHNDSLFTRLFLVKNVSSQVSGNSTLFAEYLAYHFVHGNFQNVSSSSNESRMLSNSTNRNISLPSPSAPTSPSSAASSSSSATSTANATSLLGRIFRLRTNQLGSSSVQLESGIFPNTTLGRTFLNASELVQLPGNNSQALAWTRGDENSNVTILNQMYVFYPLIRFLSMALSISPLNFIYKRWFIKFC